MSENKFNGFSLTLSLLFHIIMLLFFMMINLSLDYEPSDYVELSFGVSTKQGSSGSEGNQIDKVEEVAKQEKENLTEDKNKEVKEVKLPSAENTSDENVIKPADKEKEISINNEEKNTEQNRSNVNTTGTGNDAKGKGSFGFDIDWGGKGIRKIYYFKLPKYPEGVQKEVDVKLQFTILPDGTIGTIIPKIKADTRLENAAINSLRKWRFEALDPSQKQVEQSAVIIFPYRLQ